MYKGSKNVDLHGVSLLNYNGFGVLAVDVNGSIVLQSVSVSNPNNQMKTFNQKPQNKRFFVVPLVDSNYPASSGGIALLFSKFVNTTVWIKDSTFIMNDNRQSEIASGLTIIAQNIIFKLEHFDLKLFIQ